MQKVIQIGDREVSFLATAATPIRFNQIFAGEDFYSIITDKGLSDGAGTVALTKLAYTMAMQAEKADFHALSMDTFVDWLDGFDSQDINNNLTEIADVYMSSRKGVTSPK